ncbi:MAG: hypothetical protein RSB85_06800 [Rikenellaceae bacterium]
MRKVFLYMMIFCFSDAVAQEVDSLYIENQRKDIADYNEQFFNSGELIKKTAKDNVVVMASIAPTSDYGKLYRLYISVYNNTEFSFDVLDRNIYVEYCDNNKITDGQILTYKDYNKRVKSRGIAYEVFVGDLDRVVYGRNPDIQRNVSSRKRDNKGGGDDTLYMSRSKTFRNETTTSTRINYNQANRYMLRQMNDNSNLANGIKGIMSDNYFRSNTLTPKDRFTSGYITFKRRKCDTLKVKINLGKDLFIFVWDKKELDLL